MKKTTRFSPEVRERAVRLVLEHQADYESEWAAIRSIAAKIGCTPETLRQWLRRTEGIPGRPAPSSDAERLKELVNHPGFSGDCLS